MINAMTISVLFVLFLIAGLIALRHWAAQDQFTTKSRPTWFD